MYLHALFPIELIFLGMGIDDQIANLIQAQLLFLESSDPKKDIIMYINSPGGSVYAGLGIYDTMQYVNPDVATILYWPWRLPWVQFY